MELSDEKADQAELRKRLGKGARFDADNAPALELQWMRRGTAYFARKLCELRDDELDADSLVSGWTRRHVIAAVGYDARIRANAIATGLTAHAEEYSALEKAIDLAATLPARALRNLFQHSEIHLNVELRDCSEAMWTAHRDALRRQVLQRSATVWLGAVDLDNGGSAADFPADFLSELPKSTLATWPTIAF